MRLLVACEESQAVCIAFREHGHEAYSCDILECSGGHPEWHIQDDVIHLLNGRCNFKTCDGEDHTILDKWDMIIAFPPCTFLTVTANRWYNVAKYGEKAIQRIKDREQAIDFFMIIANSDCDKIVIENPIGVMSSIWRKPDQIVQPYFFGDSAEKRTCLWIKGVDPLIPTNIVIPPDRVRYDSGVSMPRWYAELWNMPKDVRSRMRAKTFPGLAKAMAYQWG